MCERDDLQVIAPLTVDNKKREVLQREPTPIEVSRGVKLMIDLQQTDGKTADQALDAFCLLAYNLDEFIYLD